MELLQLFSDFVVFVTEEFAKKERALAEALAGDAADAATITAQTQRANEAEQNLANLKAQTIQDDEQLAAAIEQAKQQFVTPV
jgi:maltose-binding protein MalE